VIVPRRRRRFVAGLVAVTTLLPATLFAPVARAALPIDLLPPVGIPDTLTMVHDRVAVVPPGVLGNDLDLDGGATAILDSSPTHGTVSLTLDGGYTYRPNAGYVGTDVFRYRATSSVLNSLPTPVTITITNAVPVAVADAYATTAGGPLVVPAPGVLKNDVDADGDGLTAEVVIGVAHGTLSLSKDGAFTYTPVATVAGADGFTYRIWDGVAWSVPATVAITMTPLPTPTPTPGTFPTPTPTPGTFPTPTPTPGTFPTTTPTLPPLPIPTPRPTPTPTARPTPTATPPPTPVPSEPRPSPSPSPVPAGPVAPGGPDGGTPSRPDAFALPPVQIDPFDDLLGGFDTFGGFEWVVPAIVLAVPGLLLIVALLAQAAIGVVWLPMVRRHLAGVGLRRRRREPVRG